MKRLFFFTLFLVAALAAFAQENDTLNKVTGDTIKLLAGDKEIVIVTKRAQINKSIEDLSLGKEDLQKKIDEFQTKIDSIKSVIDELSAKNDQANGDKIDNLQETIDNYNEYIEALQEGIDDINEQLEELQEELADLDNEDHEETIVTVKPNDKDEEKSFEIKTKRSKFRGHWSAVEYGLNNFVLPDGHTIGVPQGAEAIEPIFNRSWQISLNFAEVSLPVTRWAGFVTGIGLQWNNYRMKNDFPVYDDNYVILLDSFPENSALVHKAVFKTLYFNLPLLFEVQIPVENKRKFFFSAGVVGSVNVKAKVKRVYNNGIKQKASVQEMVSPFRYGATFRIGYRSFQLYTDYYFVPLFADSRNPQIYPVSLGFRFNL